jgi:hypothetical protein
MTQEQALAILKTGANVFITGEPGSGKTHTVNQYISYFRSHDIEPSITASTGIAATHVGGMTIHSWSGTGIKRSLSPYDLDAIATREPLVKRLMAAKILIIDEISMLDAVVLDMVDQILVTVRQNTQPFGGVQMIFVGDFFQLPPIPEPGSQARFAFESRAWARANPIVCYLSEQHRQEDEVYLGTLSAIRRGDIDDSVYEHLETRRMTEPEIGKQVTRLYTHNADVDRINTDALKKIAGEMRSYKMDSQGNAKLIEGLKKNCMSPETLALKVGATVMFTKNNFEAGFVNGTLGTIESFEFSTGKPVVRTDAGKMIVVETMEWAIEDGGKILAKVIQVPLRLAWAITIHKSQGMSLDAAHMDLGRAFEYGQGYVALSRVRTIEGLYLQGLNARALEVHPTVLSVDHIFRDNSAAAEKEFGMMDESEIKKLHEECVLGMGGTVVAKKEKQKSLGIEQTPGKKKLEETRKKYPNAGRPWSQADSDDMVARFEKGESETAIGRHFGRKPSAIHARLVQLGIIEEDGYSD